MAEHRHPNQKKMDRRKGAVLLAGVFLVVIVVLTIAQASIHDWFLYSAVTSSVGGVVAGTEWGMVALGILLGAGLALVVGYTYLRIHERYYGGARAGPYGYVVDLESGKDARAGPYGYVVDLESGKGKMQAASEQEREYVARYGQKAYQMGSGNQIANMPQPLTPGHTSTLRIKALPEQELTAPGRGWSLGRLLSFSWDPLSKAQSPNSQGDHAQPSRLGDASLSSAYSTSSSISPINEPSLPTSSRTFTYTELAEHISSPFGFLRAGSAAPAAYDHHSQPDGKPTLLAHHHQAEGLQPTTPRKGAGLLGQVYSRKLEQAQQALDSKAKLTGSGASGEGNVSANPRIMVLRESGDVEVNVELGDRENTADGSFMRTTMHRRRRTSSASEAEEEAKDAGKGNPSKRKGNAAAKDEHAPEVVPADVSAKKASPPPAVHKPSQFLHKQEDAVLSKKEKKEKRPSSSPVFLSPATSLNSTSPGLSRHGSGGRADFDSLATAAAASAGNVANSKSVPLSSAALQKMDGSTDSRASKRAGRSAASVKSVRSVKSAKAGSHSRSSSVEWQDVELQSEQSEQSEAEDRASLHSKGSPKRGASSLAHAAAKGSANAAHAVSDSERDEGLSEGEMERGGQDQSPGLPVVLPRSFGTAGQLRAVRVEELGREGTQVGLVVCITLEQILPRPQAGLLARMLRLADVPLLAGGNGVQPIYVLTPGSEYRIGVGLFQAPGGRRLQLQGASWLRIGLPGGQPVTVPLDQDEDSESGDWAGNATWTMSQEESGVLATAAAVAPLEVTIGLQRSQPSGKATKKGRKHKGTSQDLELPCTLQVKMVPRGSENQNNQEVSDTYSPPAELLAFWRTWNGSAEDIQDCTVICAK